MTQSKKDDSFTIDVSDLKLDDILDTTGDITINLDNTYGTTTTYWAGDSVADTISISDGTFTIDTNSADWLSEIHINDTRISPEEIESMCKEYPSLEKVWRNFKSVYDMVKQDYEGKKKAGEIDDDIPF
jgi:plasmid maintenance system antidote protein VapI